ncbi:immunoglobulin domain-containing protein [Chryseobacterium fistulae]|uniref:GEVED domain-containing protein n=1 Tax=Chryseobacterium fistulae TaxID=2675058 RepID=A0A6N4XIR9_9FLAO|nr:GEVED domain-containing protein [Chryseobacterium fistulae]CAA7385778.1 hypothetical protein CHRY9393_00063 [Chryseobacterium fistulae]
MMNLKLRFLFSIVLSILLFSSVKLQSIVLEKLNYTSEILKEYLYSGSLNIKEGPPLDDPYDFGDAPESYDMDKDGTNNPVNFKPARNLPNAQLFLGTNYNLELVPHSVSPGADNNGSNGDGVTDDGLTPSQLSIRSGVINNFSVTVKNTTGSASTLYAWIDFNNNGRFESGEITTVNVPNNATTATLSFSLAQINSIPATVSKVYMRLRLILPGSGVSIADLTGGANGAVVDERAIADGLNTGAYGAVVSAGEVEDYQLTITRDYGDVPASYENGDPASHTNDAITPLLSMGNTVDFELAPNSVAIDADNNGLNGDGADEDGITTIPTIVSGAPFSISMPVKTTVDGTKYLYGWIDVNGDGIFSGNEAATVSKSVNASDILILNWASTNTTASPAVLAAGKTYARFRVSDVSLNNSNSNLALIDTRSYGLSTGVGEVEDYQFLVDNYYDYGDAPATYGMDKDGTNNPVNFKPARNLPTPAIHLGQDYTYEYAPHVTNPGDDNNGANGDGITDDGLTTSQLTIRMGAINIFPVTLRNTTATAATLYGWIDFNNNGRFEAGEESEAYVASNSTTVNLNFSAAQINSIPANVSKVYMRLRLILPGPGVTIADFTSGTNSAVVDERAIADGLSTGAYGTVVSLGEVEDYQLTITRDYGDVPASYENGDPASQTNDAVASILNIGETIDFELAPNSVIADADNNGTNGDGVDEDGVMIPQTITSGTPFSISLPIKTTVFGTKYLYGWIDFNGDGIFNGNEAATASSAFAPTGNLMLNWPTTSFSPAVLTAGKVYVRFRLTDISLANANSGNTTLIDTRSYGLSLGNGEIEDYQFLVDDKYDYGDAPESFDMDKDGTNNPLNFKPARQAPSSVLRLGSTVDTEITAQSVLPGADNNGSNGDGLDEDGISSVSPIYRNNIYYVKVSVLNATGNAKTLYGWIDFNNNGRFESSEMINVSVPNSASTQQITLSWSAANTNTIPIGVNNIYMRLRISDTTLADLTSGANATVVDERAIADGLNTGAYDAAFGGEIEDYLLPVPTNSYDFGDNPDTYDTSVNSNIAPARHLPSPALYLGSNYTDAEAAKLTTANATGDDSDATDDEDSVNPFSIESGSGYDIDVTVNNTSGAAHNLYGWIDFNNNGRFESTEMASASVPNNTNNGVVTLVWAPANTVITGNPSELQLRLRISGAALTDGTSGVNGALVDERALADGLSTGEYDVSPVINIGEVEDYTIVVTTDMDYGDVPVSYEQPNGTFLPARQALSNTIYIGGVPDLEPDAQSVAAGADNNGLNGDGADENGIIPANYTIGVGESFTLPVNVTNTSGAAHTLYGWIDFNNNGVFDTAELASVNVPNGTSNGSVNLAWTVSQISTVTSSGNRYLRLRLSDGNLTDLPSTTYDERAYADGLNGDEYNTVPKNGEIEDYRLNAVCKTWKEFNSTGGTNDTDGLRIEMTAAGNMQIYRKGAFQIFHNSLPSTSGPYTIPGTQHGLCLSIGGTYYTTGTLVATGMVNGGNLTVVSNTCPDDFNLPGGVQKNVIVLKANKNGMDYFLTVTYTYTYPQWSMNVDYKVDIPVGNTEIVRLAHGWDTYLAGGDAGPGFIRGTAPDYTMGVIKGDSYEAFRYRSGVAWSGWYSGVFAQLSDDLGIDNTFRQYIDNNPSTDNGIGISINFGTTPGTYSSNNDVAFKCDAPNTPPVLTSYDIVTCTSPFDLTALHTNSMPADVILRWYDTSTGNLIADPTNITASGNYEAEYYDTVNFCTSPRATLTLSFSNANITAFTPVTQSLCLTDTPTAISVTTSNPLDTFQWYSNTTNSNTGGTLIPTETSSTYTPPLTVGTLYYYVEVTAGGVGCVTKSQVATVVVDGSCGICYKPATTTGVTLNTMHGITSLNRASSNSGEWPGVRKGAWTALEAKTKGFVINRFATTASVEAIANPVEGMMVFDEEADCLKIYTTTDNGTTFGWSCFSTQACPD